MGHSPGCPAIADDESDYEHLYDAGTCMCVKPFTILSSNQRSEAWRIARLGRLTGSCAADMLATVKSGEAAARRNLRTRLVLERLTGMPQEDTFVSSDMQRGIEMEPIALAAYQEQTGYGVQTVGFLGHPTLMAGCSPDAQVDNYRGIVEIKCPKSATHLSYLKDSIPGEYLKQCQHNLWVSGAEWCDFVSFDPRFPPALRLKVTRIEMDDQARAAYELMVRMFLAEVEKEEAEMVSLGQEATR